MIAELDLRGIEHVLDLGCGDGSLTAQVADRVPDGQVVGIDASHGMIEAAIPKSRANLQFLLMDIDDIAFVDQFDVVISNAALHWVKDHGRLIENLHRSLRPGGRFRFNFAADGNCAHFFHVIRETMAREEFSAHFGTFEWPWYMPTVDEYSALLHSRWPSPCRVWGENADRFFPDVDAMVKWIDQPSLVPFLPYTPESKRESFRQIVVSRMIEETKREDGRCFETFRRINVYGTK